MKVIKNMNGDVALNAELVSKIHIVTDARSVCVFADNEKLCEMKDRASAEKYFDQLIRFVSVGGAPIGVFSYEPE